MCDILRGRFVNLADAIERDAEFVFALPGRDILVRGGFDIGIHAQGDGRAHIFRRGDAIDVIELRFALDVEE